MKCCLCTIVENSNINMLGYPIEKLFFHSRVTKSGTEIGENNVPRSVLKVKGLSWRSPQVSKLFKKLDVKQ